MKTTKKILSILLAVLMLTGSLGLFASASDPVRCSSVEITSSIYGYPFAGRELPTVSDFIAVANTGETLRLNGFGVYEVAADGTTTAATGPFVKGKTYQLQTLVIRNNENLYFDSSTRPTVTINGEAAEIKLIATSSIAIAWRFTARDPQLTVTADPPAGGTLYLTVCSPDLDPTKDVTTVVTSGTYSYPYGTDVEINAIPNNGYIFVPDHDSDDGAVLAAYGTSFENDETVVFHFAKQNYPNLSGYTKLKMSLTETVQPGDWYFDEEAFYWWAAPLISGRISFSSKKPAPAQKAEIEQITPEMMKRQVVAMKAIGVFPTQVWFDQQTENIYYFVANGDYALLQKTSLIDQVQYNGTRPCIKQMPNDAPTTTTEPDQPTNNPNACKYCGEVHTGFLGFFVRIFHSILALFGLRK